MKARPRYDALLKDLFQKSRTTLLDQFTGGVAVQQVLSAEFSAIGDRRADLVLLLANGKILHLEFQSFNDRWMTYRMGIYGLMIWRKYGRKIRQVVIYVGDRPMKMESTLDTGCSNVEFRLADIRDWEAQALVESGNPADFALAMLARGGEEWLSEIVRRVGRLEGEDRERVLEQLTILAGLRRLSGQLKMEMETMRNVVDIQKNVILKEIWDKGKAEGAVEGEARGLERGVVEGQRQTLTTLMQMKFGEFPKWARDRVARAPVDNLDLWLRKVLTAPTLEEVLGKRR
jgi:hypothetical protein